jgi:hypothetical protein
MAFVGFATPKPTKASASSLEIKLDQALMGLGRGCARYSHMARRLHCQDHASAGT